MAWQGRRALFDRAVEPRLALARSRVRCYRPAQMLFVVRFVASSAIVLWGLAMLVLGLSDAVPTWVVMGIAVAAVGAPLLASHPWATAWLYPPMPAAPAPKRPSESQP